MTRPTAKVRRKCWLVLVFVIAGPGALATYVFAHSIPWANFQSWFALLIAALGGWAAETPVETEAEE